MLTDADVRHWCRPGTATRSRCSACTPIADGALWLRALLPRAAAVTVHECGDAGKGRKVATLEQRHPTACGRPRAAPHEALRLSPAGAFGRWRGNEGTLRRRLRLRHADRRRRPALLRRRLAPASVHDARRAADAHRRGRRRALRGLGAERATRCVVGDFNAWDGRRHDDAFARRRRRVGDLRPARGPRRPLHVRAGRARRHAVAGQGRPLCASQREKRPATASIVAPLPPARALPAERAAANARQAPVAIYELHAGSWRRHPDGGLHSAGTNWPLRCRPMWPTWASRTSSCCPSASTLSTVPGATRPWACTRRPRASARPKVSPASSPPATRRAWACWSTGCRRISRPTPSVWRSSTAARCTNTPTRAKDSIATGIR